jgi:hypothetical protein
MNNNGNEEFDSQQQEGDEVSATEQQKTVTASKGSTGPRTPTGKERTKHNAIRHGVFSRGILLQGESKSEFDELRSGLWRDFEPEDTYQELLVNNIAINFWRRQRLLRTERAAVEGKVDAEAPTSVIPSGSQMDRVLRYETHLYRALERDLNELERAQDRRERKKAIVVPHRSTPSTDDGKA